MDKTIKAELDKLHGNIIAALYIDGGRSSDVSESVRSYDAGQIALLRLFWRLLPDRAVRFSDVRNLYVVLKEHGDGDAEKRAVDAGKHVTAERVKASVDLWSKVIDMVQENPDVPASECLYFVIMTDVPDRALAEQIMVERWPGSIAQAQDLLKEMKESAKPLTSGVL